MTPITPWPPLITSARQPAWMPWRDALLTLFMWLLLAFLCRNALATLASEGLQFLGLLSEQPAPDFHEHWRRMQPYWAMVGLLVLWLLGWAAVWVLRRSFTRPVPMPAPLDAASEAARHGTSAEALLAWRQMPVAIVHVNEQAHMRAEAAPER